jgi:hypothetical protein
VRQQYPKNLVYLFAGNGMFFKTIKLD